jgi:hypothetical protein
LHYFKQREKDSEVDYHDDADIVTDNKYNDISYEINANFDSGIEVQDNLNVTVPPNEAVENSIVLAPERQSANASPANVDGGSNAESEEDITVQGGDIAVIRACERFRPFYLLKVEVPSHSNKRRT